MEQTTADLGDIAEYFEYQIALGDSFGLPGLGSFVANSSTEIAPQDTDVATKVSQHNARLENGFKVALQNSVPSTSSMTSKDVTQLAGVIVIFANGLWSLPVIQPMLPYLGMWLHRF